MKITKNQNIRKKIISKEFEFKGKIRWDKSKPDGTPKKQLSIEKMISLGWAPKIDLIDGIKMTINDFIASRIYI